MSKETYIAGFRKAAEARGVDPSALAEFVKSGFSLDDIKKSISNVGNSIAQKWREVPSEYKPYVGGLAGMAGGGLLGAVGGKLTGFGAGRGALAGMGIGGIGGSLYGSHVARGEDAALHKRQMDDSESRHSSELRDQAAESEAEIARINAQNDEQVKRLNEYIAARIKENKDTIARMKSENDAAMKAQSESFAKERSGWEAAKSKMKADYEAERRAMQDASDKAKAALNGRLKSVMKELNEAKSQNEVLRIIKDDLKGFESLPPETQEAVYREVQKNMERVQKQIGGIEAYRLLQSVMGIKPSQQAPVDFLKERQDARDARADRDLTRRAYQEAEREQRLRDQMKDAPTFVLPDSMRQQ